MHNDSLIYDLVESLENIKDYKNFGIEAEKLIKDFVEEIQYQISEEILKINIK